MVAAPTRMIPEQAQVRSPTTDLEWASTSGLLVQLVLESGYAVRR